MMKLPFRNFRLLLGLVIAAGLAHGATAASIAFKFGINGNGGLQNTNVGALQPTDTAGAPGFEQSNWNVLGRWGDSSNNAFPITDSSGAAANITVHWDATGNWSQAGGATPTAQATPDGNLMNSYIDSNGNGNVPLTNALSLYGQNGNNKPMVYLSGLQAWLATQSAIYYDVVVYSDGDATSGRGGEYWLVDATGPTTSLTFNNDLTTHAFICDRSNFVSTASYSQVPVTVASGRMSQQGNFQGNYVVFPSLTNDSFLLRQSEFNTRTPINAMQIVPRTTALPAVIDPLLPATVYAGGKAVFRAGVGGVVPMAFRWQKDGVDLADGAKISGSQTATLTISPASSADVGNYSIIVSNAIGTITSPAASLAVTSPARNTYAEKIFTNNPVAYWRFNDTSDPYNNPYAVAADVVGGFSGTYGSASPNSLYSVEGPRPSAFPGFETDNGAFASTYNVPHSWVTAPPLGLNTNAVTMMAWIYPTRYSEAGSAGLIFSRTSNNDVNGLDYQNNNQLGYTWNGLATTYNFASGLVIPSNMWSFVALVLTPTNATLYLYNANGQLSATNTTTHTNALFAGPTLIGCDPSSTTTPENRAFDGRIDEAAVFAYSMSPLEVYNIYKKGLGLNYILPSITTQPASASLYPGRTATFAAVAFGDKPLTYQWRKHGNNLTDGANISGATTPTLVVSNVSSADADSYTLFVSNLAGNALSDPAVLAIVDPPSPMTPYETSLQGLNPQAYWRFNEATASLYAYDYWGGNIATNENVITGVPGPVPPDFPGFGAGNMAAQYDGATVSAATDTHVGYINNTPEFSIVGWFKISLNQIARTGLFGQNDVAEFGFHGADASGLAQMGIWTPRAGAYLPQSLVTLDQWCFAAAVGATNNLTLYLFTTNGSGGVVMSQAVSATSAGTNYGSSLFPFRIGGGGILDATGNYFGGNIDEVAVFRRALTQGEVVSLFTTGLGVTSLAPQVTASPASQGLYAGRTLTLNARAVGSAPLTYQWRTNGVALTDGGNVSGATTPTLVITNTSAINSGDYDLVVANAAGSATSALATVTVVVPGTAGYESTVIGLNPLAYYRLNETSGTVANEYAGGFAGTYGAGVTLGVPGPRKPPFLGFESTNVGIQVITNLAGSYVTAPFGTLGLNTVTMTMWINPVGAMDDYAGLLVSRGGTSGGGFGYTGGQVGYTWNGNNANTYNFRSGLIPPLNQWSFVALVVSPTNAIVYMYNTNAQLSATNVLAHTADVFGTWMIGRDNNSLADDGTRVFNGQIDEVAVFTSCLTPAQIQKLYSVGASGPQVTLSYQRSGNNLILTWPQGTLLQAPEAGGTWTPVLGNPVGTYTVTPDQARMFYKVQVQ